MDDSGLPTRLWTTEELAELLRLPEKTLAEWRHKGTGPAFVRMGKHVRYRPEDIAAWLDASTEGQLAA
ncbi:helix-turn-helix transcriptional regulator [Actinokineospora enzanensis]|uniref:helix-turn-helix transcriptional regulator n=1 Tax=Actinokineospora enzanensis TaxID=155975 RepID=UPI000477512B|nr:helix-turn-helix domain-containing protein [Actinokineospora enzanensis]